MCCGRAASLALSVPGPPAAVRAERPLGGTRPPLPRVRACSTTSQRAGSRSSGASPGGFRSPRSTIGTSMSGSSNGSGPARPAAGSDRRRRLGAVLQVDRLFVGRRARLARLHPPGSRARSARSAALGRDRRLREPASPRSRSCRDRALNTGRFDLGNMVQAVWATAHGHPLRITDLRGDQISRLAAHVDPILVAVRAALVALAERRPAPRPSRPSRSRSARCPCSAWPAGTSAPSARRSASRSRTCSTRRSQWLTLNEFHPVALATPLLLFAFDALDRDRLVPVRDLRRCSRCTTKEEIGLVVAGMGLWYALARRRADAGGAIVAVGRSLGGARGRGRDPALQPRRRLALLLALRRGGRLAVAGS